MLFKAHMPKAKAYEIHEVGDTDKALQIANEIHPDLVVLDYNMPGKNGLELARAMQASGIHCDYVLLTANTQKSIIDAADELGFVNIIEKPITQQQLTAMLAKLS